MNKLILYIAISKDGFIADENGGIDWLPSPNDLQNSDIFGYNEFIKRIDTILMGSKSFKQIMEFGDWVWHDKKTVVFSSQALENKSPCIAITKNSPVDIMHEIKLRNSGSDIWLLGGAELVRSFAKDRLIDEIILTIIPKTLGDGIYLDLPWDHFDLQDERLVADNIIQKFYSKVM